MIKVEYVQHWGNDLMVVNAARVSFGNEKNQLEDKDKKLINYLADHRHMTPFEHMGMTVKITCPLYIRSQIMRHRTFSYNEISRRYTGKDIECYKPSMSDYRAQSRDNKQCSSGILDEKSSLRCDIIMQQALGDSIKAYNKLIESGLCREQARGVLPNSLITEFYMTGNLRNWIHFLSLRESKEAQAEVVRIAKGVRCFIDEYFEVSSKALRSINEN